MAWDGTDSDDRVVAIRARSITARLETQKYTASAVVAEWEDALIEVIGALAPVYGVAAVVLWRAAATCPADVLRLTAMLAAGKIRADNPRSGEFESRLTSELKDARTVLEDYVEGRKDLIDDAGVVVPRLATGKAGDTVNRNQHIEDSGGPIDASEMV